MKEKESIRPGLGDLKPYVPGKPIEEVEREFRVSGVIKLASNENPLGPPPRALEATARVLKDAHLYPDQNSLGLKEALARRFDLAIENLILGNGSDEIMQMIAATFLNAREEVIMTSNAYSTYEFVTKLLDGDPVFVPLKNYAPDLEAMLKAITPKTKLVFICNPNSPTGTIVSEKEVEAFLLKIPEGITVIFDEAYAEYVNSKEYPKSLGYVHEKRNVIVLRTFSKIYGLAGLRVGYGIAKPEIIRYLNLVKLPFNVNRVAQTAAMAALEDEEHFLKSIRNNEEGKRYFYSELEKLKLNYVPTQANFIFIEMGTDADMIFLKLLKEGVIVRPLASFGLREAIRVTIGTPPQNQSFIEALKKVLSS